MKSKGKIIKNMLIGMIGAAICMLSCWMGFGFGAGNIRNGFIQSNWVKMSYMRLEIALILSAVGIGVFYIGARDYIKAVKLARRKRWPVDRKTAALFEVGMAASLMGYLFIYSGYIMMAIVYKYLFSSSLMGADIISVTEGMFYYIAIPLFAYLLIAVLLTSLSFMYMVYSGMLKVSRICLLFNPLVFLGVGELIKLAKIYYLTDFAAGMVPFGYLLMMAAGAAHVSKMPDKRRSE